ncbi:hypothetical protein ACFPER_02860 [Agromyces aurantiacus]|uniref:Uncharacterized protein n=1 Tax=Agromyces aurantiacus TaxID=165814 RepID=A0ABV9R2X6_9MICO|nr:hypothetical protein [Agromyces aurantiacus]MBM7506030.1 hypothetical protein [Agromyces aurantiacus]
MMQISEFSFPHLREAHDDRIAVELERRRLVAERRADGAAAASPAVAPRGFRAWAARLRSSETGARTAPARRGAEPCVACP